MEGCSPIVAMTGPRTFRSGLRNVADEGKKETGTCGNPDASNGNTQQLPSGARREEMTGIQWERDFSKALEKARQTGKPVFQDFWFDG
jgi:hypothetical protein